MAEPGRAEGRHPSQDDGPPNHELTTASVARPADTSGALLSYVAHFQRRVLVEALRDAMPATWDRKAREFINAMPWPSDFNGRATPEELDARRRRCLAAADACRARAVAVEGLLPWAESEVDAALEAAW